MKKYFLLVFMTGLIMLACISKESNVKYTLTDEQLSRLMFDIQLSEVALAEVEGGKEDSLRNLVWLRLTEIYKQTEPEIKGEIRKLESDPGKMKIIMDRVQAISDSIQ
jgi:hypothetical protein